MSPDDTKDPNTAPDFSSVPLPEENPIRSPYAPASGTLGDVADDLDKPATTPSEEPAPAPTPSGAFTVPDDASASADAPASTTSASDTTIPTAGTLGAQEEAFIPGIAADKVQGHIPDPNAATKKNKGKLIGLICGAVALVAVIVLGVIFIPKLINNNGGNSGGNGHTGPLFTANAFVVEELSAGASNILADGKFLLFSNDGQKIGNAYDYLGSFIDGATLAKRSGLFGIINDKGEEIVEFGKYQNIVELGGLYGATDENSKNYLLDGTGRVVLEYTNQFDNYSSIETHGRAAYTLFSLGDGKYDIYSARGEKLTTIEAGDSTPTISSNNFMGDNSVTSIFYDGKMILYGDSGNEILRKDNVSRERMLIKEADTKNGIYLFATATDTPTDISGHIIMPTDGRSHAVIVGDNYGDIDSAACPVVIYERKEGDGDGLLVCYVTSGTRRFIGSNAKVTANEISDNYLDGTLQYGASTHRMYATSVKNYLKMTEDGNGVAIYVNDAPVKSFINTEKSATGVFYVAYGPTNGGKKPRHNYPYYVIVTYKYDHSQIMIGGELRDVYTQSSEHNENITNVSIYDTNGDVVCEVGDDVIRRYGWSFTEFDGFDNNGLAVIGGYSTPEALMNKKCEVVSDDYYSIFNYGYFYSARANDDKYTPYFLDSSGKIATGIDHSSTSIRDFDEAQDITVLTSNTIIAIKDKIIDKAYGDNIEIGDKYVAFVRKIDGKYRISYYLREGGKLFYETDIDAVEIPLAE